MNVFLGQERAMVTAVICFAEKSVASNDLYPASTVFTSLLAARLAV